jgi:hypothetical protein
MRLLVLSTDPVDAAAVRSALGDEEQLDRADVLVVSPAMNESPLAFWLSDSDEAIDDAGSAARKTATALRQDAGRVRTAVGESEPLLALQDALATFPADRILIFTRPEDQERYKEEDVVGEAQRRFGVPVKERTHRA